MQSRPLRASTVELSAAFTPESEPRFFLRNLTVYNAVNLRRLKDEEYCVTVKSNEVRMTTIDLLFEKTGLAVEDVAEQSG